ncbi:MAG: hypothetical protein WAJ87_16730 [Bryobacteraceae bacterium]
MNFAKRRDRPIFLTEQIRGFRMAAFRVAAHCGAIQNLDSGSARLQGTGSGGLSHHMLPILSRMPAGASPKLFHFRYITMNEWFLAACPVCFVTVAGNREGSQEAGKSTVLL